MKLKQGDECFEESLKLPKYTYLDTLRGADVDARTTKAGVQKRRNRDFLQCKN